MTNARLVQAQTLYGSIVGTVTDQSGAAVPEATVTASNMATGASRSTKTTQDGLYTLSTLPAGTYRVKVAKAGFKTFEGSNIALVINTTARVDASLAVGSEDTTVTVVADVAALETDRVDVHGNINSVQLQELPLAITTYQGLVGLLPGVTPPQDWGQGTNNPAHSMVISVNGTSRSATAVSVDGVSAYNPWVQFFSTAVPSAEAIETVNVVTSSSGADQGIMNGGGIRVQIKSGTNTFHGSTYWRNINNALMAKPTTVVSSYQNPKYIDNDLGATIGGPILKDKLFFFGSYEGEFTRNAGGGWHTLPTPNMVKGIFPSQYTDASGNVRNVYIYDPATGNPDGTGRTPFPQDALGNYVIPSSRFASASKTLMSYLPSGVHDGVYQNNIWLASPTSYNLQRIDTKFDWDATQKLRVTGRYSAYPYKGVNVLPLGEVLGGDDPDQHGNIYQLEGMATYVFSPNLVMDASVGFTHMAQYLLTSLSNQRYALDVLKIPGTNQGPLPSAGGVPQFRFSGMDQFGYGYPSLVYQDPVYEYAANVTWNRGKHSIRFGIDITRPDMNHKEVTQTQFNFWGGGTAVPGVDYNNIFNSWAQFLLGQVTSASSSELTTDWVTLRSLQFSPYIADTWQINRKLTLYAGTAWDYFPVSQRQDRGIEYYDDTTNKYYFCGVGGNSSTCGITTQKTLFAPRGGFAYRITPKTVLRAGYSLAPEQINMSRDGLYNYPMTITQGFNPSNSFTLATTLDQGLTVLTAPDISSGTLPLPANVGVSTPAKNFVRGYTESYNVTAQREFPWGILAQAGYVGTLTVHQHTRADINYGVLGGGNAGRVLNQKFGVTVDMKHILPLEHMNYKSMQIQVQKRTSSGFTFNVAYTLSKWMGMCCDANADGEPQIMIPQYFNLNWALMPDDRTHNFQFSSIYELPFGKGKPYAQKGLASAIAGGWQTNWILSRTSGTPFSVTGTNNLEAPDSNQNADIVKGVAYHGVHNVRVSADGVTSDPFFDGSSFANVETARFGTAGWNSVRGPAYFNVDGSIFRTFSVWENLRAQFRLEALNLLNHPNWGNPDSGINDSQYTQVTSTVASGRSVAQRYLRLGLKLQF